LQALGAQKEVTELRGALREVAQRLNDVQQQQQQSNVVTSAGPPSKIPGLDRLLELLDTPSHFSGHEANMAASVEVTRLRQALFKAQVGVSRFRKIFARLFVYTYITIQYAQEENVRHQAVLQARPVDGQLTMAQVACCGSALFLSVFVSTDIRFTIQGLKEFPADFAAGSADVVASLSEQLIGALNELDAKRDALSASEKLLRV
jgi:hypothetical protein